MVLSLVRQISAHDAFTHEGVMPIHGAPEGADALLVAAAARAAGGLVTFVARDGSRAAAMKAALGFFASDIPILRFPAWDCLPYDRVSPSVDIVAERMATLSALAQYGTTLAQDERAKPLIVITQINSITQRVPPRDQVVKAQFTARPGDLVDTGMLGRYLLENGYARASTVREPGDFAIRGGLIDIFAPGATAPLRLDFFGDTLESIRTFDADTQRSLAACRKIHLAPASEVWLTPDTARLFRQQYRAQFGPAEDDPVYEAVSGQRKQAGMEHWLPLFYERLDDLFDYLGDGQIFLDHLAEEAARERFSQITDYHEARADDGVTARKPEMLSAPLYRALSPHHLYLRDDEFAEKLNRGKLRPLSPFKAPEGQRAFDFGASVGRNFAAERAAGTGNVFEAVKAHIMALCQSKKVIITGWSAGSVDRMRSVLEDHGLEIPLQAFRWQAADTASPIDADTASQTGSAMIVLGLECGFETDEFAFISEADILGDRLVRRRGKRRADNFLTESSSLSPGDLVVHMDHGIGRYQGLKTVDVSGAPHDCLHLDYFGGDKLFLPVENIELLSRFGSDDPGATLDRLGGAAWQLRKSKMRERIRMMASELIKIAAQRAMNKAQILSPPDGSFGEFCARFPFVETEDQENAISDVINDLMRGHPMDRLICGDVGFGKTEVALRAAFIAAMAGRQVALIAPTTLLVRQHYRNFSERFAGFPVKIRQLSRMVSAAEARETRAGVASGDIDIVIGTHALLSGKIAFRDLALVIIDEEQHFGVRHKERLKEFRADTHVLTLTATPIPRTLQLSMTGIRDLSLIATPPIDRLAIRTTIGPFDPVVARETLLREHYRGGQSFFVAPRVRDLTSIAEFLTERVPEVTYKIAHGQLPPAALDDIMNAFYEGKFDVLVATTIIESGIDIPTANTLLVHRAEMFGLGQLYQIRGRIGRSKARAFAYLTTGTRKKMTDGAERRLKVLQSLDTLGAGFTLASHDLDIRGAGNLLGEEQSGNVKEVGVELYQHMLEEAVAALKEGSLDVEETWSPSINIGTAVLIPDSYVADLNVRISLYRRLADMVAEEDIEAFGAELVDRFGPLPAVVGHLLQIASIKSLCRRAGVARIDAGAKGALVSFRQDSFANPAGLVAFIAASPYDVKLRPDQKIVFKQNWADEKQRLKGCRRVLALLAAIAEEADTTGQTAS